jgi:hypothetical protein
MTSAVAGYAIRLYTRVDSRVAVWTYGEDKNTGLPRQELKPNRPVRRKWLYWLSYGGSIYYLIAHSMFMHH